MASIFKRKRRVKGADGRTKVKKSSCYYIDYRDAHGILRRVKNLRKISISPWADLEVAAREIGTDYVISFKPNPAYLAHDHWQPELVREYLRSSLERLRGCRVEVILKDISTIRGEPRRLAEWEKVARAVIAEWSPA